MNEHLELVKYLINKNKNLIKRTAIKDCHCLGLHSFIINSNPKIRLFIADETSELHQSCPPNLIIPIHHHKYDDYFQVLQGGVIHICYEQSPKGKEYCHYSYPRIGDKEKKNKYQGKIRLQVTKVITKDLVVLPAKVLHTVITARLETTIWTITELKEDKFFKQEAFSYKPMKQRKELYQLFPDPIDYINEKLSKI